MFNYLVFIGRFQPFHFGHFDVVKQALKLAGDVILVIGSHDKARDSRNPFTTAERIEIIKACFSPSELSRIHFSPQYDHTYNEEKWIAGVQAGVNSIVYRHFVPDPIKIGIVGYNKDHSSFYLKKFPGWELVEMNPTICDGQVLSATRVRDEIFRDWGLTGKYCASLRSAEVTTDYLKPIRIQILAEIEHVKKYKEGWANAPYPPTFHTVDAVVTQSGHILLVQRDAQPGRGLWALPGGFLNQHETLREGVIRELKEETKIDVPVPVLAGSIGRVHTYDDPYRSVRGRTITTAYHFKLTDTPKLPKVKGSDDAKKAKWFSIGDFVTNMRSQTFEDHYQIVEHILGL
jgi:bifunctional NMN adenylyltransferase/nudix hydrolase